MPEEVSSQQNCADISVADARTLASSRFGFTGPAEPLEGFADRSFLIGSREQGLHVLKLHSGVNTRANLEMQNALLRHLATCSQGVMVPAVVPDRQGRLMSQWRSPEGEKFAVRMLTFVPGEFACDRSPPDARLLRSIGRGLAQLDRALL